MSDWVLFVSCFILALWLYAGLPGVLFVLPDSYVDAENKDYGGTS